MTKNVGLESIVVRKLAFLVGAFALVGQLASAQPAADQTACQKRADRVARAVGGPTSPVVQGSFSIQKDEVATVYGECAGLLFVQPDPELFFTRPAPAYPGLVVRAVAAAFGMEPAQVRGAIDACLTAAVDDPLHHSGRAGLARQRWRNSQMTGTVLKHQLTWECTYHNSEKAGASLTVSKPD